VIEFAEVHGTGSSCRVFAAFEGGCVLGAISVDEKRGTVELVRVEQHARRQGLATKLLEVARQETCLALDCDTGQRSSLGALWAASVGLECDRRTPLDDRQADAAGAGLFVAIYGAQRFTRVGETQEEESADAGTPI
jgi:GNAT superfamily N-acetyltransferase